MEFQKITNFLDITSDDKDLPTFVTKKWIEVYDEPEKNYNPNKEIRIKASMVRSDLFDFNDPYIVVNGNISVNEKPLLLRILKHLIRQQIMQLLPIMQIIILLVKQNWFLKIMHHLSIVFQKLMV